jgi:hypothetical protein
MRKATTTLIIILITISSFAQTANDLSSYLPYTGKYGYGLNPGWYGYNWSTQNIIDLGNKNLGGHSFRMQIYDNYMHWYGDSSLLKDYKHLQSIGADETAVMIGGVSDQNYWNPFNQTDTWIGNVYQAGKMFKGMYEPIWINGEVNPANTFAVYVKKVVDIYGPYIKFYEVWNEPDFTYGDGGWLGDTDPPNINSWFYRDPTPEELVNVRAPAEYYIRLLRISWEVIKKYQPTAYVCTGGIGNRSFLSVLLRKTDNPNGGTVTVDYPFKGGAYFDVLSFHTYPEFLLRNWAKQGEPASADGFYYYRHSDSAIAKHLMIKNRMDALLRSDGYNGVNKPVKQFICTETGFSRIMSGTDLGGNEVQKNYIIKAHIKTQMDGQIKQTYWYATGDGGESYSPSDHWANFGCHYYFGDKQPGSATPSDQGIAVKTLSDLLYGSTYDPVKTASLKLSSIVDGGAFKKANGSYIYVLWAKTSTDLSENATASVSLPACIRKEWNYSVTGSTSSASGSVALSGTPSFFEPTQALPINDAPNQGPPSIRKWYNVEVTDITGRLLMKRQDVELQQLKKDLHNSRLSSGTYIIKYHNGREAGIEKYVKL